MKKMTAKEMRQMVGCKVNYRGREATIESVRPDMERLGLPSLRLVWDGGVAILRPCEIAAADHWLDARVQAAGALAAVYVDDQRLVAFAGERLLTAYLDGGRFVFSGGQHGEHSIEADSRITSAARLLAHWQGYVESARSAS
jgi:hypothetical protein